MPQGGARCPYASAGAGNVWRTLLILTVVPVAALLGWLALHDDAPRADFVFTTSEPRTLAAPGAVGRGGYDPDAMAGTFDSMYAIGACLMVEGSTWKVWSVGPVKPPSRARVLFVSSVSWTWSR